MQSRACRPASAVCSHDDETVSALCRATQTLLFALCCFCSCLVFNTTKQLSRQQHDANNSGNKCEYHVLHKRCVSSHIPPECALWASTALVSCAPMQCADQIEVRVAQAQHERGTRGTNERSHTPSTLCRTSVQRVCGLRAPWRWLSCVQAMPSWPKRPISARAACAHHAAHPRVVTMCTG